MMNYLPSGWIENLGVVPLFLLAAFLFLPIFLSFILLLHLVCIVFDAIILSLLPKFFILFKSRQTFLYILLFIVKGFSPLTSMAKLPITVPSKDLQVFLAKGEQYELKINKLESFSIGNSQVISIKNQPRKKRLLIKGKSLGFSDVIIWSGASKKTYKFYVISKRQQSKRLELLDGVKNLGLQYHSAGGIIQITGKVTSLKQYGHIKKLKEKHPDLIWIIYLEQKLKNRIIANIYKLLYPKGADRIQCHNLGLEFHCQYRGNLDDFYRKYLKQKYLVVFEQFSKEKIRNYQMEFKIIQLEHTDSHFYKLGLDEVSSSIQDLLQTQSFLQSQVINIQGHNIKASLIANPKSIVTLDERTMLSLGAEIPFSQNSQQGIHTQWKFAGLKIECLLKKKTKALHLNYQTDFTQPNQTSVNGSRGAGSLYIHHHNFIKLFEITYESEYQKNQGIPGLRDIPILKLLFQSVNKGKNYKQIIGFVMIKEIEHDS
jgi:hypothetical protein